jgi:hypothetical protein
MEIMSPIKIVKNKEKDKDKEKENNPLLKKS